MKYLGFIVGSDGVKVDPAKTSAIATWEVPRDKRQLRSFLGLANYFRKFILGYSTTVAPLTALTCEAVPNNITDLWNPACQAAFDMVKKALTEPPVLAMPDLSPDAPPFEVISDASTYGTGALLMQGGRPVAYHSAKFIPAEINYTTTEQEMLGVIHALKVWRCYLETDLHTGNRPPAEHVL